LQNAFRGVFALQNYVEMEPCISMQGVRSRTGAAMFLFYEIKAKTTSRGREKFLSRNLFVTTEEN
jgi:hypothetical protein